MGHVRNLHRMGHVRNLHRMGHVEMGYIRNLRTVQCTGWVA